MEPAPLPGGFVEKGVHVAPESTEKSPFFLLSA